MTISTHVLDVSRGRPAAGVAVRLLREAQAAWVPLSQAVTNEDGRAAMMPAVADAAGGVYRLVFDVAGYFAARQQECFYTQVAIDFVVRDAALPHHVPLLLGPYGYTTYRGS